MPEYHRQIEKLVFQYPKGLLHTVSELDISHAAGVFPKTKFSMVIPEVEAKMAELCEGQLEAVILFGIEVSTFLWVFPSIIL